MLLALIGSPVEIVTIAESGTGSALMGVDGKHKRNAKTTNGPREIMEPPMGKRVMQSRDPYRLSEAQLHS
jgi:hypothetical protein